MIVRDVMSTRVKTVGPTVPAEDAWRLMRAERIHHLVVIDGKAIVGVVSDGDAGGPKGAAVREGHSVAELMATAVVTVSPDTPVKRAANLLRGRSSGCIVVTMPARVPFARLRSAGVPR